MTLSTCYRLKEEVIARLGKAQFLSKLDIFKGFHQVPMADNSKDLTTFSSKFGKYRFLTMPFGLKNVPSTFQVMMQHCLLHLEAFLSPYMDDEIIFSQSWPDHLSHLSRVCSLKTPWTYCKAIQISVGLHKV